MTRGHGKARQVADSIRDEIRRGGLQPGDRLPTIAEYMDMWSVSLNTVRAAQAILVDEGLLETAPGVGVFVAAAPAARDSLAIARDDVDVALRALEAASRELAAAMRRGARTGRLAVADPDDRETVAAALRAYAASAPTGQGQRANQLLAGLSE